MAPPRLTPSSPGPRRRAASVARSAPTSRVRPLGLPSPEQDLRARAATPGESAAEAAAGTLAARPTRRGRNTAPHLGTPAMLAGRPDDSVGRCLATEWGQHTATRKGEVNAPCGSQDEPADSPEETGGRVVETRHGHTLDGTRARGICRAKKTRASD
ncbi:hypothetical protein NDU88_000709 [Pleurodeles waltl]|uniref:Uncharacterized protein n=1 Tax=Pleurodeles waltl TaxID=8319 RepID=A0AAV7UU57_PLEWA|nr:hypothetical protein NDU88_000709 [Pleurodeles waltl]